MFVWFKRIGEFLCMPGSKTGINVFNNRMLLVIYSADYVLGPTGIACHKVIMSEIIQMIHNRSCKKFF